MTWQLFAAFSLKLHRRGDLFSCFVAITVVVGVLGGRWGSLPSGDAVSPKGVRYAVPGSSYRSFHD